jgi:hypothetical protein
MFSFTILLMVFSSPCGEVSEVEGLGGEPCAKTYLRQMGNTCARWAKTNLHQMGCEH